MSGSAISFSEQEMMRIQGQPARLIAGKRITLSTQTRSGLIWSKCLRKPGSAMIALSTIASQTGTT